MASKDVWFLKRCGQLAASDEILNLDQKEITIGRSEDTTYCLISAFISRQHAIFKEDNGCWFVKDCKSGDDPSANAHQSATSFHERKKCFQKLKEIADYLNGCNSEKHFGVWLQILGQIQGMYSTRHPRHKEITKAIIEMMYLDCQPFSIVEDECFRKLMKTLEPHYNMPHQP